MQNKQNILKNQLVSIFAVGAMMLVALANALFSEDEFLTRIAWVGFALLAILLVVLVLGLRHAKTLQSKIDRGDVADKDVQKLQKAPVYDERQQQFVLKSYQIGFWVMIFLLWMQTVLSRVWSDVVSPNFMVFATLLVGSTVNVTYATLKGASPFVDSRFGKYGKLAGLIAFVFGLVVTLVMLWVTISLPFTLKEFFAAGGNGTMLVLGLGLCSMGGSILYRLSRDKREADE